MAGWIQPGEKGIWFNVKDELKIIWWIVNIGGTIMQSEVSDLVNYHSRAAINFMANLLIPFFDQITKLFLLMMCQVYTITIGNFSHAIDTII